MQSCYQTELAHVVSLTLW
uniref:Uncharacterized protein n=1 Tax=Anguilla anguilla TaxID=7936 RepID=A0A0E9UA34_ANGAN